MRKTRTLLKIALALMADPHGQHWGYSLGKSADVRSGVLYPALHRLLDEGWLEDGWEDPQATAGRPPRRYYKLTELGITELGGVLAAAEREARAPGVTGRLAW